MFCGLFNFDENRCIRTIPAWPFCSLVFLVEFFKCWKYPSNSSETFKFFFFHQNNQFEEKTACLADFSILTKITVSGPYRRGHFVGWFFWLSFSNVENTLRILLKHSKFCSFIRTISLKQKQHVLRTFQFWPKSLYPDLTGVAILLVDFFGWVFQMLKIPFEFSWNIQNFFLSSKQSVWSKNSMFCGLFNFDENLCIRTLPAWPFFWLIFWNVENTLPILLKHSKCCSFIKTISLMQKQHVLRTFQLWPKSLYPDITGVAILLVEFFGWVFQMLKIPFEFFWNIKNFVLSSKQSVWSKNSMFCGLFNFDENRCIRTLPSWAFCWLIFWLSFSIVGNTLRILLKHSKFCSYIKTISLKQKQHVLRTFQFWPKSLYPGLTGVAIFLVDFLKCWKYPSNSSETFKILFFRQNNKFEAKTACFAGPFNFHQNRCIRTLPAWAFCWLIFLVQFFNCWRYPSNSSEILKILFFHQNNQFEGKTACFADFSILTKIAVSGPYRAGAFFWLIFGWVFQLLKIPVKFFWNIQNFVLTSKKSVWSKNSMFCGVFNFDQNRCIRTLPAWPFFWLIFWNVENTLPILLKHSKCCSFIKTISLKQKQHVLPTFQFWPKSLYPDHYRRGHFVGWFFWLSFSNVQNTLQILLKH